MLGVTFALSDLPATAHGDDSPPKYVATVTSAPVGSGDADARVTVTIANLSRSSQLGSVNLAVAAKLLGPTALALTDQWTTTATAAVSSTNTQVIELRNLKIPAATNSTPSPLVTLSFTAGVRSCLATDSALLDLTAKSSGTFSGTLFTGNDPSVSIAGPCQLRFIGQPTSAERNAVVTTQAFTPSGPTVSVGVYDAEGDDLTTWLAPVTVALGYGANPGGAGTPSSPVATVNALAAFAPTIGVSAPGYTLSATSAGLTSSPASSSFNIVDDQVVCAAGQACGGAVTSNGVTANFGAGAVATNLALSVGAPGIDAPECAGYPKAGKVVSEFEFFPEDESRVGTISFSIPVVGIPRLSDYQVCFSAPYQFMTRTGVMANIGLLPDCFLWCWWFNPHSPCVIWKSYDFRTKMVTITFSADGRDPRWY